MIRHYQTCNSNYPEKPEGEQAQKVTRIPLDEHQVVLQCVDCGAFEVEHRDNNNDH